MKTSELTLTVGEQTLTAFLQAGFFDLTAYTRNAHRHRYAEIHVLKCGEGEYRVENRRFTLHRNEALIVPANAFHQCVSLSEGAIHSAFQLTYPADKARVHPLPDGPVAYLTDQIEKNPMNTGKLSCALAMICAEVGSFSATLRPASDPRYLLHERMVNSYDTNLTLKDLAAELGLSTKQTERLIVKFTGNTFRNEIARLRMEAARYLLLTENISPTQAAERVGYRTYSGFWKAYHRQDKNKNGVEE